MIEFKYRPDIDGLRAVAVMMVLVFHAGLVLPGGYVGVDVFFVISGFLITGLILKQQNNGTFSLANFWARRIRRILPAVTFMVMAVLVAGYFLLLPEDYENLGKSAIAQQLMMSNVYFWKNTGYFSGTAELKPLLHTWSLAVEEQFYIFYPFLLLFLKRFQKRTIATILTILTIFSLALSQYGILSHPSATFYLLPTRSWELLVGGLICFAPDTAKLSQKLLGVLSWLAIAIILSVGILFDSDTLFPGINALLPCGATALFIYANTSRMSMPASILATKPVVLVGLMSYSLYLWHWPLFVFAHYWFGEQLTLTMTLAIMGATFVLAYLSWRFIETPLRRGLLFKRERWNLLSIGGSVPVVLTVAFMIIVGQGFPRRIPMQAHKLSFVKKGQFHFPVDIKQLNSDTLPTFGDKEGKKSCLIWGDSHAMHLIPGSDAACKTLGIRGVQATWPATAPLLKWKSNDPFSLRALSPKWNQAVIDYVERHRIQLVILAAVWSTYSPNPDFEQMLQATVTKLTKLGVSVAIILDVPKFEGWTPRVIAMRAWQSKSTLDTTSPIEPHRLINRHCDEIIKKVVDKSNKKAFIVDPTPHFLNQDGQLMYAIDDTLLYRDDNHLSEEGALRLTPMFQEMLDWHFKSPQSDTAFDSQRNQRYLARGDHSNLPATIRLQNPRKE